MSLDIQVQAILLGHCPTPLLPSWIRNKPDAKVLLRYLPQLKAKIISQKKTKSFQMAKRALYQHSLNILT